MTDRRGVISLARVNELLSFDQNTGEFVWKVSRGRLAKAGGTAGFPDHEGYVVIRLDGRRYRAHRIAWLIVYGTWPDGEMDHINQVRNDNRVANLRVVTRSINQQNKHSPQKNNSIGLRGVSRVGRTEKWKAEIKLDRRKIYLGVFDSALAAHEAYLVAKARLHPGWVGAAVAADAGTNA